ncbi:hypothetical protein E2C01_076063 [Portunus trituberculatus]|uniref:Uncharacterized protein n=1 Tax=Portunus trituberculatus TaxID=210409 RepID=A0A5B7IIS6_PORTR|nr:hypothetical protein [Portunus trituberculatus]
MCSIVKSKYLPLQLTNLQAFLRSILEDSFDSNSPLEDWCGLWLCLFLILILHDVVFIAS